MRNCNQCKRKDSVAVYQLSDYYWICEDCNQANKAHHRNWQTIQDWDTRESINSLDEALNYFNFLQKGRLFSEFAKTFTISGSKGPICHQTYMVVKDVDPLLLPRTRYYDYFVCYNREYLAGYAAARFFERPSKRYQSEDWQSLHSKVIEKAIQETPGNVRIVIVMRTKKVLYVDPLVIRKWADEWECEHKLQREWELTCSIPVSKLETKDPFFIPRLETKTTN